MRERNLLKQAVQSQKTLSRKAKARLETTSYTASPIPSNPQSLTNSRNGSREASRAGSRAASSRGSDDEDEEGMSEAGASLFDWMPSFHEEDEDEEVHFDSSDGVSSIAEKLKEREFFRGSNKQRAAVLNAFGNTLANSYFGDELSDEADEVLVILMKCLREGTDSPTTVSALRAISLLVITVSDDSRDVDTWYTRPRDAIKACIYDSASPTGQIAAIIALGTLAFFGCPDLEELEEVLNFFLEIAESNGESIEAKDNNGITVAAMDEFGFANTLMYEEDSVSFRAFAVFEAHLEHSAPEVLISCAQNLALLYEQCYSLKQADDDSNDADDRDATSNALDDSEDMVARPYQKSSWVKRHDITDDDYELKQLLRKSARSPLRWVKKDERKIVHRVLRDAIHALDYPWRGPRFSTAIDKETGLYYGHRSKEGGYLLDRWWKVHRVMGIKRVLRQGFKAHLSMNPRVRQALRRSLEAPSRLAEEEGPGHEDMHDGDDDDDEIEQNSQDSDGSEDESD